MVDGKTGYLDKTGSWYIEPRFEWADRFEENYAVVKDSREEDAKWGIINRRGDFVVPFQLEGALRFKEGFAAVQGGGQGRVRRSAGRAGDPAAVRGGPVVSRFGSRRVMLPDRTWGFIDKRGRMTRRDDSGKITFLGDLNETLARFRVGDKWGYVSQQLKVRIDPIYDGARDFENGIAAVKLKEKWLFIDKTGRPVTRPIFDDADDLKEDVAMVEVDEKFGYINRAGEVVIKPQFEDAQPEFRDRLRVSREPSFAWLGTTGTIIYDPQRPLKHGIVDLTTTGKLAVAVDDDQVGSRLLASPPLREEPPGATFYEPEYRYDEMLPKAVPDEK